MQIADEGPSYHGTALLPMIGIALQVAIVVLLMATLSLRGQEETAHVPASVARPPAMSSGPVLTMRITPRQTILFGGVEVAWDQTQGLLEGQHDALQAAQLRPAEATLVLRAEPQTPTGRVQELIELAQRLGFERFRLLPAEAAQP